MSENSQSRQSNTPGSPHKSLGRQLKVMRQRLQESLGETSGAVEIEVEQLDRFERGAELPSEDILMLLISHFGVADDEAVKVWELAGYEQQARQMRGDGEEIFFDDHQGGGQPNGRGGQPHIMLLALDQRVLYTNTSAIDSDDAGIVINFSQAEPGNGPKAGQQYVVGRMGMSYVQAEELVRGLQQVILRKQYLSGPKGLPSGGED
jgi:transcriptional regulator with XRE-family HTH domain